MESGLLEDWEREGYGRITLGYMLVTWVVKMGWNWLRIVSVNGLCFIVNEIVYEDVKEVRIEQLLSVTSIVAV